ncbi:hypothetical protein EPUS_08331 [Endocarpon pusillum Z07020]|uniref:Choline transport protein n=1 Tax=Endocarpon pusillum (strain Z07020 / HMAS-L-300199) TaxID=1263415 RepID=U1GFA1_ENDPU|nr:uncharacterized protein EPUS_08331 [Endocarpon pusillum Z07020]ERF70773.1 hypothetical protein EPUS_08331 [Endocarpon pusillum Z07020]
MGEMASMIPLSGGQYNWVAILSPPWCSKFLSYFTGWMSIISWQSAFAGASFLGGSMIQGLARLNYSNYEPERWHATLIFYAIVVLSLIINTIVARLLPKIESVVLILHILGFFCVLIPMVYLGPHVSAKEVFANFTNAAGWSDPGLSFFIGLSTGMFAFIGCDAASHMAEEIENASTIVPTSMLASVILNGSLGFAMVIATLFCLRDAEAALHHPTGFPFIEIFLDATNSRAGTTAMASIVVMAMIFATIGCHTTASRMAWAFARERGLPGSGFLAKVESRSALPLYAIGLSTIVSLVLALINIGSSTTFHALISLTIAAFYSTFLLSAGILLHKRLTTPYGHIHYGPFRLGRLGVPIIILSILYSVIGFFFSFWPPSPRPTAVTMNWSVAVFGGTTIFSLVFWLIYGRKVYTGPLIEIELR